MEERLKKLMEMLPEELDGAILLAPVHRKYYLGIVSSAGSLIITREVFFYCRFSIYRDGKETDQRCGGDPAG